MIKVDHFLRTNLLEELLRTQFRYDRKDQQCKKEKSLILAEGSDQEPSNLEDPDYSKV